MNLQSYKFETKGWNQTYNKELNFPLWHHQHDCVTRSSGWETLQLKVVPFLPFFFLIFTLCSTWD
jgi:hypothetical protein